MFILLVCSELVCSNQQKEFQIFTEKNKFIKILYLKKDLKAQSSM